MSFTTEELRLRTTLLEIALNGCGIPGHAVAVGCGSNAIAAKALGIYGWTDLDAARRLVFEGVETDYHAFSGGDAADCVLCGEGRLYYLHGIADDDPPDDSVCVCHHTWAEHDEGCMAGSDSDPCPCAAYRPMSSDSIGEDV